VHCIHRFRGCGWNGARLDLIEHVNRSCEFHVCPRSKFGTPSAAEERYLLIWRDISLSNMSTCPEYSPISSAGCTWLGRVTALGQHEKDCLMVEVTCDYFSLGYPLSLFFFFSQFDIEHMKCQNGLQMIDSART
jgi:hypothetical protein